MPSRRFVAAVVGAALAGTLVAVLVHRGGGAGRVTLPPAHSAVAADLARLPVAFERNVGQGPDSAKFLAREPSYNLAIGATGATLALRNAHAKQRPSVVTLRTLGSNGAAKVRASGRLRGTVNYFQGSHRYSRVATFGQVRISQVYPGVDLTYHGSSSRLEYDFALAAGVAPATVRLGVSGASTLRLDAHGNLIARTAAGTLVQQKPVAYQTVAGHRRDVAARFVLHGQDISFAVSGYDRSRPLVIDPVLSYSTYLGGGGVGQAYGVALDASGDIFVSGLTNSFNFVDASNGNSGGDLDAFVVELNPSGSEAIYSTYLGGDGDDEATAIALDSSGDAYVTGFTNSSDFPLQGSTDNGLGYFSAFVTELDPTGTSLVYSRLVRGTGTFANPLAPDTEAEAIAVDGSGAAYITGLTNTYDLPTTAGAFEAGNPNGAKAWAGFAAKIEPADSGGPDLAYLTYLGPSAQGIGIAVVDGNAYITGSCLGAFPTTPDAYLRQISHPGHVETAFVAELNADASALVYATLLAAQTFPETTDGAGIQVMPDGKIVVVGATYSNGSSSFPLAGAYRTTGGNSNYDGFLSVLDPSAADQLVYSTYIGGSWEDDAEAVAVDPTGDVYVTGRTWSSDFQGADTADEAGPPDTSNAFVVKVDPSQTGAASLVYSTYLGGAGNGDWGAGIALGATGGAIVVGLTSSAAFPTASPLQASQPGSMSGFVSKLDEAPLAPTGVSATPGNGDATVSWTAPALDGGKPVTSYTVTASPGGATKHGTSPLDFTGLANGTQYTFTVVATNSVGNSAASSPSNSVTPGAPAAPSGVSATAGAASAAVAFTAPAADNGSPVTGYTVTSSPGGLHASAKTSPITVRGLTPATTYTFTVVATNKNGDGAASDPSAGVAPFAANGSGTAIASVGTVSAGSTHHTIVFTYTVAAGGISGGALTLAVPAGWSAPSASGAAPGYTTASSGSVSVYGRTIGVSGLTKDDGDTVTITYGSRTHGGAGATASGAGTRQWVVREKSVANGFLVGLASSPSIAVLPDHAGTMTVSPTSVAHGAKVALTFTYRAGAYGVRDGAVTLDIPYGWSTSGAVTSTLGSVSVSDSTITVAGLTLAPGATVKIVYTAPAPYRRGRQVWHAMERSSAGGTLGALASSPGVTVT